MTQIQHEQRVAVPCPDSEPNKSEYCVSQNRIGFSGKYFREQNIRISRIKHWFEKDLKKRLNLEHVSSPLFLKKSTGLNDTLNSVEAPVSFKAKDIDDELEIVQSLAKWKRYALHRMEFEKNCGIVTRMNAIRKDEDLSPIHSVLVTQWDWERVISSNQRTEVFLKEIVCRIYKCLKFVDDKMYFHYGQEKLLKNEDIHFITSEELYHKYPELTDSKAREDAICQAYGSVFLMKVGGIIPGTDIMHDGRAADYDDWELNGDILVWNKKMNRSLELSSMGVRVDAATLMKQLKIRGEEYKKDLPYHQMVLNDKYPLTIGGGIGQCRMCLFFLQGSHIGEVHPGVWSNRNLDDINNYM